MRRGIRFVARATARVAKVVIEKTLLNLLLPFSARHLKIMIKRNWHTIPSVLYALSRKPEYPKELTPEEVQRLEAMRVNMAKSAFSMLIMARQLVSSLPRKLVDRYLNVEYAYNYLKKKRPDLVKAIEEEENGKKWFEEEIEILRKFLYAEQTD